MKRCSWTTTGARARRLAVATTLAVIGAVVGPPTASAAEPASKVFLNGVPAPVFFNDGDSFRVLGGKFAGSKARLGGYNTLESYGPAHVWGDWTIWEMYVLAKMATLHARRGVWHCESDLEKDTYGRTLWWCEDLATELVRLGHAHAMSIDNKPAKEVLLEAQREAIAKRRGMWAHGVPPYVLTSTHSANEGGGFWTYNRLVSTHDGHSLKWRHEDAYEECQKVCHMIAKPDLAAIKAGLAQVRTDAGPKSVLASYDDNELAEVAERFVRYDAVGWVKQKSHVDPLTEALRKARAAGTLGAYQPTESACMVYVDFRRRFGGGKAKCLKR